MLYPTNVNNGNHDLEHEVVVDLGAGDMHSVVATESVKKKKETTDLKEEEKINGEESSKTKKKYIDLVFFSSVLTSLFLFLFLFFMIILILIIFDFLGLCLHVGVWGHWRAWPRRQRRRGACQPDPAQTRGCLSDALPGLCGDWVRKLWGLPHSRAEPKGGGILPLMMMEEGIFFILHTERER